MKKIVVFSVMGIVILSFLLLIFHHPVTESKYDFLPQLHIENENGYNIIETKEMAYKIAREVFIEKYGYSSLLFMSFDCRLESNKYWILEGTNKLHQLFKINGGGPYIVMEKNGKILAIGHTGWNNKTDNS